ncbi:MAG: DUF1801 domain-containing protein [Acidobacteria bacterium]|nr:DUF1801 domain-containing protein [Acidobacteriota bacterium]
MVTSKAASVEAYLQELDPAHRALVAPVVALIRANLPEGFAEAMTWGMPTWEVPLQRYPKTYNGKPLAYVALAAQKQYAAIYLNMAYSDSAVEAELRGAYATAGLKLDMGKCCLRFRKAGDLLPEAIARAVASTSVEAFIAAYEASRRKP